MKICEILDFDKEPGFINDGFLDDWGFRFSKTAKSVKKKFAKARTSTMLFFLGEKREIVAAQHIAEIDFDKLDAEAVVTKAKQHNSNEIYVTHFPEDLGEGDVVLKSAGVQYPKALYAAERDAYEMIGFISFAKQLKKNDLTTVDVNLLSGVWSSHYAMNVSCELFPGLQRNRLKEHPHKISCLLETEEDKLRMFDYFRAEANRTSQYIGDFPLAYAIVLGEYNYWSYYNIQHSNLVQIPGILEGHKLMAERTIQAIKQDNDEHDAQKYMVSVIVDKQEDSLSLNESEIAFSKEMYELTKKYDVPFKEIIFLGKYHPALRQYDTLVI